MKVFISQPMNGLSDEEILKEREEVERYIVKRFPEDTVRFINSFYVGQEAPENCRNEGVYWLGKSLQDLSTADLAVFCKNWSRARGCTIEYDVCLKYSIPHLMVYPK